MNTIETLYDAFKNLDGEAMAACYADDASFSDPVFPDLKGSEVGAMWRMLCERAEDLKIEASDIVLEGGTGSAHWEAWYSFTATGRQVHNVIDATFVLDDEGKIKEHRDRFDLWRWTRMALGTSGALLGWSGIVQNKVRAQADKGLRLYMKRKRIS